MTELEKIEKLDKKLRPKHPNMTDIEYEKYRNRYIRAVSVLLRINIPLSGLIPGVIVAVCPWIPDGVKEIFYIVGMPLCMIVGFVLYLRWPSKPAGHLTLERIARDYRAPGTRLLPWLVVSLVAVAVASENEKFLLGSVLFLAIVLPYTFIRKRNWKKKILSGEICLICNPLNEKEVDEGVTDTPDTYYLHFNRHERNGRYTFCVDGFYFDQVSVGDPFYLVLRRNRKGQEEPILYYDAKMNPLDSRLQEILKRDEHLTGKAMPGVKIKSV